MADEAFELDDMGVERIVYADDPTLDPREIYYCNGTGKNGQICRCPVHLVRGSERIAPHFHQASPRQKHISGCTHAEESPYRQIMCLDRSGRDLTAEDLLKIGSQDGMDPPSRNKQLPQRGPGNQDQQREEDNGNNKDRPLKAVHKNPTSIRQLYLIFSLPGVMEYAGCKIVDLFVGSKTIQYHRHHLPMKDGIKLVVTEKMFAKDIIPLDHNRYLMQDPYWKEGGKKVSDEKRIRYVIQVSNAQYSSICNLLTNAKGKRYLILGDWKYDAATNTYRCALKKKSHWVELDAKIDCENF